jgi:hypothetical protein
MPSRARAEHEQVHLLGAREVAPLQVRVAGEQRQPLSQTPRAPLALDETRTLFGAGRLRADEPRELVGGVGVRGVEPQDLPQRGGRLLRRAPEQVEVGEVHVRPDEAAVGAHRACEQSLRLVEPVLLGAHGAEQVEREHVGGRRLQDGVQLLFGLAEAVGGDGGRGALKLFPRRRPLRPRGRRGEQQQQKAERDG